MALYPCQKCKHSISTRATACPHCGNRPSWLLCFHHLDFRPLGVLIVAVCACLGVVIFVYASSPTNTSVTVSQNELRSKIQGVPVLVDEAYSVVDSKIIPGVKRSLDIRLNKQLSEEELRVIAHKLKAQDSRPYERTFIGYYLPGMPVNAGYWATTHFNPNLEVRILGAKFGNQ